MNNTSQNLSVLLTRVGKLAQKKDTWECGTWLACTWIVERRQPPYRPNIFMVIGDCGVPCINLSESSYSIENILEHLLQAMLKPAHRSITPRRPTHICCADTKVVSYIAQYLAEIGIICEVSNASAEWFKHRQGFELKLNHGQEQLAGLATIPGVSLALQSNFYELASAFYSLKPWSVLTDAYPLEIRCPETSKPRYVVVMGSGEEIFGMSIYDTLEQARAIYNYDVPINVSNQNTLVLFFDVETSMSFDDLDAITENGWTIATPEAYPILGRSGINNIYQPGLSDLVWMEGALAAIIQYYNEHMQRKGYRVMPAKLTLPVQTIRGIIPVALRLPAFKNPKLY